MWTATLSLTQFGYINMAKKGRTGKKVCWEYGKGKYCGTLIPSKETKTHRYARTENGKIKSLPKNKK